MSTISKIIILKFFLTNNRLYFMIMNIFEILLITEKPDFKIPLDLE